MSRRLIPRNPLAEVPVWAFHVPPILGCAYLGLPWWTWWVPSLVLYLLHVWLVPIGPCRWCDGGKKFAVGKGTRSRKKCRHCGGSGERVRWAWLRGDEANGRSGFSL